MCCVKKNTINIARFEKMPPFPPRVESWCARLALTGSRSRPPSSTRRSATRSSTSSCSLPSWLSSQSLFHFVPPSSTRRRFLTTSLSKSSFQIPLPLYDILALDEENLTVTVEPMVTVSDSKKHISFNQKKTQMFKSNRWTFRLERSLDIWFLGVSRWRSPWKLQVGFFIHFLEIAGLPFCHWANLLIFKWLQMTSWPDATLGGLAFGVGMTTYSHKVICFGCWYYIFIFYLLYVYKKVWLTHHIWKKITKVDNHDLILHFLLAAYWSVKPGGAVPGDCGGVWSCVGGWLRGQSVQVHLLSISKHPNWIFYYTVVSFGSVQCDPKAFDNVRSGDESRTFLSR